MKRSKSQLLAIVGSALVAVIVVLVNYISARRFARFDLTEDRLFTLSERSQALMRGLAEPIELYVFMGSGESSYLELRELVERYRALTDKLTVHYVDPDREPARFKLLAEKYGLHAVAQENGQTEAELAVLVVNGDRRWSITRDDLADVDFSSLEQRGQGGPKIDVKTEQALSGAIVQVTSGRPTRVCVTEGHGEWSLTDSAERSLAATKEELKRENVELEALETRGLKELPKTCDAIFVLGPQRAFTEQEAAALGAYLEAGGNLMLALDPVIEGERIAASGLEGLTAKYGISLHDALLVELDERALLSPSPVEAVLVKRFGSHPLVRPLAAMGVPIVVQATRTLGVSEPAQPLLDASDKAYGERQLGRLTAGDELGPSESSISPPVHVAAVVDTRPKQEGAAKQAGGRMIVIGDADWLTPEALQQPALNNVNLLASATGYLTEREALISIAPRKIAAQAMMITEQGLFYVFLRVVVLMPLAFAVLGLGVWWQRRQ